jgi:hypothetical protein
MAIDQGGQDGYNLALASAAITLREEISALSRQNIEWVHG